MARQFRGGVEVDGLEESIKALGKVNPLLKREAVAVFRKGAKEIQAKAQGSIGRHPAYRLGTQRGMIGRSATASGAGIRLRAAKYPWALSAEFGERVAHVFGTAKRQQGFTRRTAPPHKPPTSPDLFKNKGGYLIQPAIRKMGPRITKEMQQELLQVYMKAYRRAGVTVRG